MRLLSFSFPYRNYIAQFYLRRPSLKMASFDVQREALEADRFPGASDALSTYMTAHGYEVHNFAFSIEPLQRAWGKESAIPIEGPNWDLDIARAQVFRTEPHILIIDPYYVRPGWLRELRTEVPSIRLVLARHSSPKRDLSRYRDCDLVVSGDRNQVDQLLSQGMNAALLHHGFDPRILDSLPTGGSHLPVYFAGQVHLAEGFHFYRAQVLEALLRNDVPIELRMDVPPKGTAAWLGRVARRTAWRSHVMLSRRRVLSPLANVPPLSRVAHWDQPPPRPIPRWLWKKARPAVFGQEMYREMSQATVTLNTHGDVSKSDANNLRLWEATGVGSCLLTDNKKNLSSLFEVGKEVVAFDSPEDCTEKARWLLDNPHTAKEIAAAGQRRTLRDHTYRERAVVLDELFRKHLKHRI